MDNFKIIYKILKYLEQSMDLAGFDIRPITHEALGISRERWEKVLVMLQKNGYIEGLVLVQTVNSVTPSIVANPKMAITLRGLEYLAENSLMKKAEKLVMGVIDAVM